MKRDLWNELAMRVRAINSLAPEMPFRFEDRVLSKLGGQPSPSWNPLHLWLPLLRPAVGLAIAITTLCLLVSYKTTSKPTPDLLSETEALIQMAVLNE